MGCVIIFTGKVEQFAIENGVQVLIAGKYTLEQIGAMIDVVMDGTRRVR